MAPQVHELNNLLAVILVHAETAERRLRELAPAEPEAAIGSDLCAIMEAATRAVSLLQVTVEPQASAPAAMAAPAVQAVGHRLTVLVVEDEPALREMARRMLSRAGYQVITADSGATALGVVEAAGDGVDLVLTDVSLPRMSGPQLARRLYADHPGLPVVFVSGYSGAQLVRDGVIPAGAALLQKPYNYERLLSTVGRAMSAATQRMAG